MAMIYFNFNQVTTQYILQEYLSYFDIEIDLDSRTKKNGLSYAQALKDLAAHHGNSKVSEVRWSIRSNYTYAIQSLGLYNTVSPYSKSISWVFWDLGKQFFYFNNPDLSNSNYTLQDPCISLAKQREILCRHLGWEVYHYDLENSVLNALDNSLSEYEEIENILQNPQRKEVQLSAHQYAYLGNLIIQSSAVGNLDFVPIDKDEDFSEWAYRRKSKYMAERLDKEEKKMKESLQKAIESLGNSQKKHFEKLPNSTEYIHEYGKISLKMYEIIKDKSTSKSRRASLLEPYFVELDKIDAKFQMTQEQGDFVLNHYFYDEWSAISHFLNNETKTE